MGKAADNEQLKIKATFWNNLGVGLCVGGFFLPLFLWMARDEPITWRNTAAGFASMSIAFFLSLTCKVIANSWAGKIED
jgi:hypothetical protein